MTLIGVLAEGENPSASQQSDALESFNDLLDSWSTEGLIIPSVLREEFTLTPGQAVFTMGHGGDFDTERPMRIEKAAMLLDPTSESSELPVEILNLDQWAKIQLKGTQSNIPLKIYVENSHPLERINLWPVPSAANKLALYSQKPLSNVSNVNTEIVLPKGYARALRYSLAIELCPEFGRSASAEILSIAASSKEAIKRLNIKPVYMQSDAAGLTSRRGFNIYTGESS